MSTVSRSSKEIDDAGVTDLAHDVDLRHDIILTGMLDADLKRAMEKNKSMNILARHEREMAALRLTYKMKCPTY